MYLVVYFNFFQKQEMQKNILMLGIHTSMKSSYYIFLILSSWTIMRYVSFSSKSFSP